MIKATELKIGNWIWFMDEAVLIDAVDSDGCLNILASINNGGNVSSSCDMADPIPLTPEILEKCGFIESRGSYWIGAGEESFIVQNEAGGFRLMVMSYDDYAPYGKPLGYLHQLQNLYFALTGEELTVNL